MIDGIFFYRCPESSECVPVFENSAVIDLPVQGDTDPLKIMGRCIEPCETSCATDPENTQCGTDGRTYSNTCYRLCARNNIGVCENLSIKGYVALLHQIFN